MSSPREVEAFTQQPIGDISKSKISLEEIEISKTPSDPFIINNGEEVPNSRRTSGQIDNESPPSYYSSNTNSGTQNVRYLHNLDGQRVYVIVREGSPQNLTRGRRERLVGNPRGGRIDNSYYVETNAEIFAYSFIDTKIRNQFVMKVYLILSAMLSLTFGFILLVTFIPPLKQFFNQAGLVILAIFMIIYLAAAFTIICCSGIARQVPVNYILLGVVAFSMTMVMSVLCSYLPYEIVLMSTGTTAAVCFLVSALSIQTKWDVTGCGICLCLLSFLFLLFGLLIMIIALCGVFIKPLHVVFAALGAFLFCFWLMYDTQQIIGGRRYEISTEEYAFAALSLYIDVMLIFMYILDLYALCCSH